MSQKMLQRRGLYQNLPMLDNGEFGLCLDTVELFIGVNGNKKIPTQSELDNKIDEKTSQINLRELKEKLYKKSIFKSLPLRFPDYNAIVTQEGVDYLYPQQFTIDWDDEQLFILYEPSYVSGGSTKRWVVAYDLTNLNYLSCFSAGNSGGEGMVLKKEGSERYLYVKSTNPKIGKYLLNVLPPNKSVLTPLVEYDVGLAWCFDYREGVWFVEQGNPSHGITQRRTSFSLFNDNFQRLGTTVIPHTVGGYFGGGYDEFVPKRQNIGLGSTHIIQSSGGSFRVGVDVKTPFHYQGLKIIDTSGSLIAEGVVDPVKWIDKISSLGYYCDRVESEGVHVTENDEVYTLYTHIRSMDSVEAGTEGIIIFKEMDASSGFIDFTDCATQYNKINKSELENGAFPRQQDGNMYNPLNGQIINTFEKICDFMYGVELRQFSFYSSNVSVVDINNSALPTYTYVRVTNYNNSTFLFEYMANPTCRKYLVYGGSGSRTQVQIFSATS